MMEEIESAALALRKQWCLGLDPIENLMEVCEDHGIKIGLVDVTKHNTRTIFRRRWERYGGFSVDVLSGY